MRARGLAPAAALAVLLLLAIASARMPTGAAAGGVAAGVEAVPIAGFTEPVAVASAPGRPRLLFVVEKPGVVRVMRDGTTEETPFLDIRDLVETTKGEGFLSIAFPPDYLTTRRFYVYFTAADRCTVGCDIEVDEFKARADNPLRARLNSRRRVIVVPHPNASNHNGGTAAFDPDGHLWLATGDGGCCGDPDDNARDLDQLLGKVLRIVPTRKDPALPGHRSPADNPYADGPGRNEIWSYGLRNPFRFSFDELTGTIAIGDVGQNAQEEVNIVEIGDARAANFGWPEYEGDAVYDPLRPGADPPLFPVYTYANPPQPGALASVTGGVIVRDPLLPQLGGRYVFVDVYDGEMRSFVPDLANNEADDVQPLLAAPIPYVTGFGTDATDRVYFVSLADGNLYRLEPSTP